MQPAELITSEEKILRWWQENRIYEKARALRKGGKAYAFLDGPPYATGSIHMGTAWNKILKDAYLRFWRMRGRDVWDQPGYDTHGLPIENKIEQQLGFKSKADIERFGVANFIRKCREFVEKFVPIQSQQFANLGVWMDWKNPYITYSNSYIEGAWHTFKMAFEKGLLYKGVFPVHVCTRCETALAYNEIEYTTLTDPSVYVKFKVKGRPSEYLLIWTTTPWTIPGNTAVMAHPDFEYARVKVGNEFLIIAKDLVKTVLGKAKVEGQIVGTMKGKDLKDTEYEHPLLDLVPALQNLRGAHRVVLSPRYVSAAEGTGLVHTAPGHGWEDYQVGKENRLPLVSPIKQNGTFDSSAGKWLEGKHAKAADPAILDELKKRGSLFHVDSITHDYPKCWRCSTPLLQFSVPEWFFKVEQMRKQLLAESAEVNWIPKWAGDRFRNWLESLGDWPISRQRYWGIPLPIWEDSKGHIEVIGSLAELRKRAGLKNEIDLHKPEIDGVKFECNKCGLEMSRVPEVLDVWFDSGAASWASLGYPARKDLFKKLWPSEFQTEGPDQIRGWWNSQLIMSMLTFGRAPFKNILYHGFILDLHGVKMSKSRGNIVAPEQVIEKYGRDVLRFYLLSFPPWDDVSWNWDDVDDVFKLFTIWANCARFVEAYVENKGAKRPARLNIEDEWILSRINSILSDGTKAAEGYQIFKLSQAARDFVIHDFSRTYIKLIRDRVAPGYSGKDRAAAEYALVTVLRILNRAMAPIVPFLTERIHQNLLRPLEKRESVHMLDWPEADKKAIDKELEERMAAALEISEAINGARAAAKIKLRWPVRKAILVSKDKVAQAAAKDFASVIQLLSNAKEVEARTAEPREPSGMPINEFGRGKVFLDTTRDEKLIEEAMIRELIRKVQAMRKESGLNVKERIVLRLKGDERVLKILKKWQTEIESGTTAKAVKIGELEGERKGELDFEGRKVSIGF